MDVKSKRITLGQKISLSALSLAPPQLKKN